MDHFQLSQDQITEPKFGPKHAKKPIPYSVNINKVHPPQEELLLTNPTTILALGLVQQLRLVLSSDQLSI